MSIISFNNVHYTYPGDGEETLRGVNLNVEEGTFVAILGHNGSGKSTLARHMNALLVPDAGTVTICGMDTACEERELDIRRNVGMVFQNPDNQIVANVVEEDVAFAPENLGIEPSEIRRRVDDALEQVGMTEFRLHAPHLLSGGQKQRVAIAGILAMQPRIIVLDEPTAMLDPEGRQDILQIISDLCRSRGMTVVLITHHMEECIGADRLVVMSDGAITADGTPAQVFSRVEQMQREGLTVPETVRTLYDMKQAGWDLPLDRLEIQACAGILAEALRRGKTAAPPLSAHENNHDMAGECPAEDTAVPPVLRTELLTKKYSEGTPFEKTAIREITLEFRPGELTAIVGHTGSGKSTFVQHLNAALLPSAGRVLYRQQDINESKLPRRDIRFHVGLVCQYPEYQLFEETVEQDIAFGPKNIILPDRACADVVVPKGRKHGKETAESGRHLSQEEISSRVRKAAAFTGISEDLMDKSPLELSGGQKRRIAIAGIIAMEPEVLILDEPTAGLDPAGCETILQNIRAYRDKTGAAVIIITHNMDDAARMADRVIVFHQGSIAADGSPRRIFSRPEQLPEGLELPHSTQLARALRQAGVPVRESITTHEELLAELKRLSAGAGEVSPC